MNFQKASSIQGLDNEKTDILLKHARSIESILNVVNGDFILIDEGLKCLCCDTIFHYDYLNLGDDFGTELTMPREFCNLKHHISRHLSNENHLLAKQKEAEKKKQLEYAKDCGLSCASAAYTGFYFSESEKSFEYHLADMFNCGGSIGSKNHSFNFPHKFRPHVYATIRSSVSNYITMNNLPFGLLADKMTSKHLTRHMVGIRIPVWDINYTNINKDIYVLLCISLY